MRVTASSSGVTAAVVVPICATDFALSGHTHTPGVRFAGFRTVAFDGLNSLKIPDTARNRSWAGKTRHRLGLAGYPALWLMTLAETESASLAGCAPQCAAHHQD